MHSLVLPRAWRSGFVLAMALALALSTVLAAATPVAAQRPAQVHFWLTILHNNDGESALLPSTIEGDLWGGVAHFATRVNNLRHEARTGPMPDRRGGKRGAILLSSGDNFLAGPQFQASLDLGPPHFDAIAMDLIGYDAIAIGNHEFDFGPDVLADFIESFRTPVPFLSANLDVSGEPRLAGLEAQGRIAASTIIKERGELIGVVGATTPMLPFISSPRNVVVDPAVAAAIQAEVDSLHAQGINKIVLISHLQSVLEDRELAGQICGVDVMIAGGGDEMLANPGDTLIPGDTPVGPYPIWETDGCEDAGPVPIVTTPGSYHYVGRLVVGFDRHGNVVTDTVSGGPVRVASGGQSDAVAADPRVQTQVVNPVAAFTAELDETVIGISQVALNGLRPAIRTTETNQGNLIADSLLWQATQLHAQFGVPAPDVALQNGGGIRNESIIGPGEITLLDTFDMVPFPNFVSIVPNVPREQFKELLENAVSRVEFVDGRFAQIAGFSFTWDAAMQPRVLDAVGNLVTPGQRVRTVTLDDGTPIVVNGAVVAGPPISIATIDFLARGGDQYPFGGASFTTLGVTYQQALASYIQGPLNGLITAADYPEGGEGRTIRLN